MSIREEFRIETGDVRQDLQKIEAEVAASSKRQTRAMAAEGAQAGRQTATEIVKSLTATFNARKGQMKVLQARGLISREDFQRESQAAAKAFNEGILRAMENLEKKGGATAEEMDRLGRALKQVGSAGKKSGEETASGWSKAKAAIGAVAALIAGSRVVRWFGDAVSQAKELGLSFLKLSASAKLFGVSQEQLNRLSQEGVRRYGLSIRESNELATSVTKLTAKAEQSGKAFEVQARLLDLAAAQGMNATEANLALDQALRGVDEGTDKLFQRNPSDLYKEYAAQIGKTAGELTEVEKKQAIVNAVLQEGAKVQGEYGRFLQSDIGRLEKWDRLLQSSTETVGAALIPILADLTELLAGPLQKATDGFVALLGGIQLMAVDAAVGLQDLKIAGLQVLDALGKLPLLGFLRPEAGTIEAAMALRGFTATAAAEQRRRITAGGFMGASGTGSTDTTTTAPEIDAAAQAAREKLRDLLKEFNLAQQVGLTFLDDSRELPPLLESARARLQEMLELDGKIAELEEQKQHATKEQAGQLDRILASLRSQRDVASIGARVNISQHAGLSGLATPGLVTGSLLGQKPGSIFAGQRPSFDPIIQQMQRVRSAVDDVTAAERELTRAQIEQDQVGAKAATEALTGAKEQLRARVAEVAKVLRGLIKDEEKLAKVQEELAGILDEAGVGDGEQARDWDKIASSVEGVARGVLATADAMGVLDDQTRKVLQGVVDLAAGFGRLGADPIGGAFQILGGGISLLSGLFGGGGGDDAARKAAEDLAQQMREQARQLRENTEALREFAQRALSGVTPADYNQLVTQGTALWDFLRRGLDPYDVWLKFSQHGVGQQGLGLAAKDLGMTESELAGLLEAIEKLTGVEFFSDEGISSYAEFFRALEALRGKDLSAFGEDLGGRLDALGFILRAMGDDAGTAEEQLQRFLDILRSVPEAVGFADALEKMVKDQGPEAAKAWLQGLAEMLGREGVTEELLGIFGAGLTAEEIGRAIEEALKFVSGAGVDASFSRSTQIARTITDIQANEVVAWLSELTATSHEQLVELQGIHEILAQSLAGALPATSAGAAVVAGGGSALVVNGGVNVKTDLSEEQIRVLFRRLGEEVILRSKGRVP